MQKGEFAVTYPSAPWTLRGRSMQALFLVDVDIACLFVPKELDVVSVLPGKTLGGIYLAHYGAGSVLQYHELIVVPALARFASRRGFWVSHIYVDDPDSVQGGREVWGLPKEAADFDLAQDGPDWSANVRVGDRLLCTFAARRGRLRWPQVVPLATLSFREPTVLRTRARMDGRLHLASGRVHVPTESPFSGIWSGSPLVTAQLEHMTFTVPAPETIGRLEHHRGGSA
jgi:acetoacetate decarboxylase